MTTAWSSWLFCRNTLGEELEQDVSEHCQRYLDRTAQRYCQSLQTYSAEEAAHHDRALKALQCAEKGTKTLLGDSLGGFLVLELRKSLRQPNGAGVHWSREELPIH